jgi:hypothetical protein
MEISLVLTNDSGSYQAILGQFIETSAASTLQDRILAQEAASAADASATSAQAAATSASGSAAAAVASASSAMSSASGAQSSATDAGTYAASASTSASIATTQAGTATTQAANASASATLAQNWASQASGLVGGVDYSAKYYAGQASTSAANAAATLANALVKANNLSDVANATTARGNLSAAKSGANSDITSLSGLTTALSIAQGGTGATSASAARTALGAAATGTDLSQFAATTSAQLAGVLTDETGSGSAVFGTSPTINSPVLNGRTSSTALGSGEIGYRTPTVTGGPTGWSNNTWGAIVSITLQPGIWDIDGVALSGNSGSNLTNFAAAWATAPNVSTATFPEYIQFGGSALAVVNTPMPTKRVQVTTATTYYMNIFTGFSAGTQTTQGACWATRRG